MQRRVRHPAAGRLRRGRGRRYLGGLPRYSDGHIPYNYSGDPRGARKQALYRFGLDGIPAGATVTSAEFGVVAFGSSDQTVRAHRITAPWREDTMTWQGFAASYDKAAAAELTYVGPYARAPI